MTSLVGRVGVEEEYITGAEHSFAVLLCAVVDGTILNLTRQTDADPKVLDEFTLLLLVVNPVRDLLKLLTLSILLEEVKFYRLVGALDVLSLRADSSLKLQG